MEFGRTETCGERLGGPLASFSPQTEVTSDALHLRINTAAHYLVALLDEAELLDLRQTHRQMLDLVKLKPAVGCEALIRELGIMGMWRKRVEKLGDTADKKKSDLQQEHMFSKGAYELEFWFHKECIESIRKSAAPRSTQEGNSPQEAAERKRYNAGIKLLLQQLDDVETQTAATGHGVRLRQFLEEHHIIKAFRGGWDGNCLTDLLSEEVLLGVMARLPGSQHCEPVVTALRKYAELDSIVRRIRIPEAERPAVLATLRSKGSELHHHVVSKLPHVSFLPYTHELVYHAAQLMERDGSIGLYNSNNSEKLNQVMKTDIRHHLGRDTYTRTLLRRRQTNEKEFKRKHAPTHIGRRPSQKRKKRG